MKVLEAMGGETSSWDAIPEDEPVDGVILYMMGSRSKVRRSAPPLMQLVSAKTARSSMARHFDELADTWERETRAESFAHRRSIHPAYQRIIGLGPQAIPLILERMRQRRSGHWFWALHALTGEDPATGLTKPREAREAWLRWGVEHGHIPGGS
jgi:hypothetical protein